MVYSATSASAALENGDPAYYVKRQAIYAALGLALMFVFARFRFQALRQLAPSLVTISLCAARGGARARLDGQRRPPLAHVRPRRLPAVRAGQARARGLGGGLPRAAPAAGDAEGAMAPGRRVSPASSQAS